jgi:CubicO group peptidase (beta-lactamase class C family)
MAYEDALAYAQRHDLAALVVSTGGNIAFEHYGDGWNRDKPHALYSGTKSFWGVTAIAAADDGLLALDEPVVDTISEWRGDAQKSLMTVRQVLNLTSGFGFGGLGAAVPVPEKAVAIPLKNDPGTAFTYGGIPLQIFGEVLRRKLAPSKRSPHDYLRERVLDPIGVGVASWRTLSDGTQPLPTGAFVSADGWLRYGHSLLERARAGGAFAECTRGSQANPRYGLGLWLDPAGSGDGTFYASGAGGQALYALPQHDTVVVHFGKSSSWKHDAFVKRLLQAK